MMNLLVSRSPVVRALLILNSVVFLAPSLVFTIEVTTPAELRATRGDNVTLTCTFKSKNTPTSQMEVDWLYRRQHKPEDKEGPPESIFHFSSKENHVDKGQFARRILWQGRPARGDASITLINATLNDNGTYTCSVRNFPDVYGTPNSHIVLTITPKKPGIRFSDVSLLLFFVLIPSGILTLALIGRALCTKKEPDQSHYYRSPIEVTEGEEDVIHPRVAREKRSSCCYFCFMDSEDEAEAEYYQLKKMHSVHGDNDESGV